MTEPPDAPVALLLVDDEPKNHVALEAVLAAPDRELVHAFSGQEALRHLLERRFAAILLDVQMPEMDGLETAALIRVRDESGDTPILFLTAAGPLHQEASYALGAVDYLEKPIEPNILRAKIAVFVELFRKTLLVETQAAALAEHAHLEGVLLAIRTVEHELGNQLAAVQGYLQLLERDPVLSAETRHRLGMGLAAAERARETLEQLRSLRVIELTDWGLQQGSTIRLRRDEP